MPESLLWLRLPKETARAYSAFCVYRDMGAARSLSKVREKLNKKSGYERQLGEWSSLHEWVKRAAAYDAHLEELLRADLETRIITERRKQVERELADTDDLLEKYDVVFDRTRLHIQQQSKLVDEVVDGKPTGNKIEIKTVELSVEDWRKLTNWLDDIHTMRRRSLRMPQKYTQSQLTGNEGGPIDLQWTEPIGSEDDIGIGADELSDTP